MLISQVVSKLNEILQSQGDLEVEVQAQFQTGDIKQSAKAVTQSIAVLHQEGVFKKCLISSDDDI